MELNLLGGESLKPTLPQKELNKYFEEFNSSRDEQIRTKIYEHNLRLITKIIEKYYSMYTKEEKEDIFSVGCIALGEAIDSFDLSLGYAFSTYAFSTYAFSYITGRIKTFIQNNKSLYIPRSIYLLSLEILKLQHEYELKHAGQQLSSKELAKILGVSEEKINSAIASNIPTASLTEPIYTNSKNDDEIFVEDIIKDQSENVYENIEKEELINDLYTAIESLPETDRKIIKLYYGINCERKKQKEIAEILNLSQTHISRKLVTATNNLEKIMNIYEEYEGEKTDNNLNNANISQTIFELYSDYTPEQVLAAVNRLSDKQRQILELKFGLNGNSPTRNNDIAKKLNLTVSCVSSNINIGKKRISRILDQPVKYYKLKKDKKKKQIETNLIQNEEVSIKVEANPIQKEEISIEVETKPIKKENVSVEDKIKEITNKILSNEFTCNTMSCINGVNIKTARYQSKCLLAQKKKGSNTIDRPHSIKKDCYVYVITTTDLKNNILSETVFVKDAKKEKFYKFVNQDTNGKYDLSKIKDNETICFYLGRIKVLPIPTEKEEVIRPVIKREIIIEPIETKETEADNISAIVEEDTTFEEGVEYFKNRRFNIAIEYFVKCLSSKKKHIVQKSNYYLGKIYIAKNRPWVAEKYLQTCLSFNPESYKTLLQLGRVEVQKQQYDKAIEYFNKCGLYNSNIYIHILERGKCYSEQKLYDKAIEDFDTVIKNCPNNYNAHMEKAFLLYKLGRIEECKEELYICEEIENRYCEHKLLLGKVYYLEGKTDEALSLFEICVDDDLANNTTIKTISIGYFFHKLGDKDLAYKYYLRTPVFNKWMKLSADEAFEHIKLHTKENKDKPLHSVFNFPISMSLLKNLIKDMEKTTTREMVDVYQIHCKDAGYVMIDENNKQPEDYITILTIPFTKNILNSYPDKQIPDATITKSVTIEELTTNNKTDIKSNKSILSDFEKYKQYFKELINMLDDPTEQTILLLRLGFIKNKNYSEEEIGKLLDMEQSEIRKIVKNALNNIHAITKDKKESVKHAKQILKSV